MNFNTEVPPSVGMDSPGLDREWCLVAGTEDSLSVGPDGASA